MLLKETEINFKKTSNKTPAEQWDVSFRSVFRYDIFSSLERS